MYKTSSENFSLAGSSSNTPFKCFCPPEGQKLPNHDENQYWQYKCVYQIWGLYMIFKATNADKLLWPIFGCKVGQSVPIGMKLELDLLHVYTKFQTDISKHVEKKPGKLRKIQNAQK